MDDTSGTPKNITEDEQEIIRVAYQIQAVLKEEQLNRIAAKAAVDLVSEILSRKE